ncbi:MAG: DUF262 domain-containing protein [Lachnospiraceae bacterium]|nr:DUF262 domain-containing protein [Lachnospiraceae bacterium]
MSLQDLVGYGIDEEMLEENDDDLEYQNPLFGEEDDDEKEHYKTNNILKAKISHYTNGLQVESVISSLESGYYVIPKFQRRFVWKKEQVANLALSIIKDVPIPPLYLYLGNKKKQVILDGQQRATAIFLYFKNLWYSGAKEYQRLDFKEIGHLNTEVLNLEEQLVKAIEERKKKIDISELKKQIKGVYSELKEKYGIVRSRFFVEDNETKKEITFSTFEDEEQEFLLRKRIDITVVECETKNSQRVYADIFKLLNSGGKLLGTQEIRNGIYWELPLYDDLFELNKNSHWRMIYGKESSFSKDIEILLKMLALNYFTTVSYTTNRNYERLEEVIEVSFNGTFNWSNIMEEYSSISESWSKQEEREEVERLEKYLNNIRGIQDAYKKCNKAVFEAVFVAICKLNYTYEIDYDWLCSLEREEEFQKGNVLSNKKSVELRLTKAMKKLKEKVNAEYTGSI